MVPDATPPPVLPAGLPSAPGDLESIEVDSSTWGVDASSVSGWTGGDARDGAARRQFRAFVLLGLAAVVVAALVALALPRTLEEHPAQQATSEPVVAAPPAPAVPATSAPVTAPEPEPAAVVIADPDTPAAPHGTKTTRPTGSSGGGSGLVHTPIRTAKAGAQLQFKARLSSTASYGEVLLNYRALGATVWDNQPMYAQGDTWSTTLSISGPLAQGFEYFILARAPDGDHPPLSAGSFRSPYQVAVR